MRLACCLLLLLPLAVAVGEEPSPLSDAIFKGRTGAGRDMSIKKGGGNSESEAAMARGLAWLARMQRKDGSWESDGKAKDDRVSATSLAVLAYLGVGEGDGETKYAKAATAAIKYLLLRQKADGSFENVTDIDGHAWATIALCEASVLTKIDGVRPAAEKALAWLVKNQLPDGSWGSAKGKLGPVAYLAWPLQAVAVARLAKFNVPAETVFKNTETFLTTHLRKDGQSDELAKDQPSDDLTAAAPMIWYFLGRTRLHPAQARAAEAMTLNPITSSNPILHQRHFFQTQFLHVMDGETWHKTWNPRMRDGLVAEQNKSADPLLKGSWSPDAGDIGERLGRLGCTAMSILSLEVYYRYLPLYKRDADRLKELER